MSYNIFLWKQGCKGKTWFYKNTFRTKMCFEIAFKKYKFVAKVAFENVFLEIAF